MNYVDIYINDVKLPTPATIEYEYSDLDVDGIRPITTGKLKRNRLRVNIQKITIGYLLNSISEIDQIMDMLSPVTFHVTLYDNASKENVTKEMYAGSRSYGYIRVKKGIKGKGFKVTLEET